MTARRQLDGRESTRCRFSRAAAALPHGTRALVPASDVIQRDIARYGLLASLDFSFYHEHPVAIWQQDLARIIQLSRWLQHTAGIRTLAASDQQRSWDIFHNEKFLLTKEGAELLHRLHLYWQDIDVERRWEPLMMAIHPSALLGVTKLLPDIYSNG